MDSTQKNERSEKEWNILFQSIYSKYYKKLCVFASSIIYNEDEAEEIVQRVIFKLWEQRDNYETIANIQSYLFRSVKNHCLNAISHAKIEERYRTESWVELKNMEIKALDENFQEEKEASLRKAIEDLPERCQNVLKMSKYEGFKNKEIADQLNISVKAVEANITRAFSILRKTLLGKDFDE